MTASTSCAPAQGFDAVQAKAREFSYADVQFSIEQLYDLRSKVIRIGLLGTLLHRPDPDRVTPEEELADYLEVLTSEVDVFGRVARVLESGAPDAGIHPQLAAWMGALARQNPESLAVVSNVNALSQRLLAAAKGKTADQSDALRDHRRAARFNFHSAVTELCLSMWANYDKDQSERLDRAEKAADQLGERLKRLERIGTHVRLVSLNASVEASHIGSQGRGLSVIAQEFKGLAEEVKQLAQDARHDVAQMRQRD